MKKLIKTLLLLSMLSMIFVACDKDDDEEGEGEMKMEFKSGSGYTATNKTIATGTAVKIGIEAESEESKDPLIKFNISEAVNGGTPTTVYSQDLNDADFEYDYNFTLSDTISGNEHKFTFTVTNRDGFNKQKALTVTVE